MTLPAPKELLRSVYRNLDFGAVLDEFPEMDREDIKDFFRDIESRFPDSHEHEPEGTIRPEDHCGGAAEEVALYFDGGSRGNPGPAGCGYVIASPLGVELARGKKYLGNQTNNVAEYEGLVTGLNAALRMGAKRITIKSDSQLVVFQLQGRYRVKAANLKPLYEQAKALLSRFQSWQIQHVYRAENSLADGLANEAMDRGA